MNIEIGKIIEIKNTKIIVELFKSIDTSFKIINGKIIKIGGINNFVKVQNSVYQINLEKIVDVNNLNEQNLKILPMKRLECDLIGNFDKNGNYRIGPTGYMPHLFQNVETLNEEEIKKIYSNAENIENSIEIGKYLFEPNISSYLDINSFFASHILIVGNTGSGKSNTLAKLYTELLSKNYNFANSKFLIIDTNGEYKNAFSSKKKVVNLDLRGNSNELKIPISILKLEDWQILTEAAEKTQYPMLKTVINTVEKRIYRDKNNVLEVVHDSLKKCIKKIFENEQRAPFKQSALLALKSIMEDYDEYNNYKNKCNNFDEYIKIIDDKIKINNDRFVARDDPYTDITKSLINVFESIDYSEKEIVNFSISELLLLLQIEKTNRVYNLNISDSNLAPYISRFISHKPKFDKIFEPYINSVDSRTFEDLIFEDKNISVCDVSMAGKEMKRTIVSLILKEMYNNAIIKREKNDYEIKNTYHIIIDEAHNYISPLTIDKTDLIYETCLDTVETIIKEGRKNGLFLTLSTQRPSDVTNTILSQCHNYVIHKLVNPKDIDIIRNSIPFLDEVSSKTLTILSPGQAIFSGTAFNKSNIINVNRLNGYYVNSSTPDLLEVWRESDS